MAEHDYIAINKANWDERAPEHAKSPGYSIARLLSNPTALSDVVTFDIPLLGDIIDLNVAHLQCHIGTDTLSLARRGAKSVVGLDFSSASLHEARNLAEKAGMSERITFVEASVYDARSVLGEGKFDLVFTGIGALCWLPDIREWARTVAGLLKEGTGRLFIREGHPVMWSIDQDREGDIVVGFPYFEIKEPMVFEDSGTYVVVEEGKKFDTTKEVVWNHGIGEIVQALLDVGMRVTGLVEHRSVPWNALPGKMKETEGGEWVLEENPERLPLSYTLQAVKM